MAIIPWRMAGVHVVALKNEVKELLLVIKAGFEGETQVHCVNMAHIERQNLTLNTRTKRRKLPCGSAVDKCLYEPNAAFLVVLNLWRNVMEWGSYTPIRLYTSKGN